MYLILRRLIIAFAALLAAPLLRAQASPEVVELDRFITRETAVDRLGNLLPTSRPVDGIFGDDRALVDLPRAVTVLTEETLRQLGINSFDDLGKLGAGTQQPNYYGVPGTPTLRGAKGSVFFDGMQRAFQRNEMPLSFGSADAMDVVKGPAPAHFGPGLVGGFVNLVPKSPYFDQTRGSLKLTAGADDFYNAQLDTGGPTLLFGRPAAYRVSVTGQLAGSYYQRIHHDYASLYAALKTAVASDVTLFTGTEYFDFKSSENAGWNRPTPELLQSDRYVIGEPVNITSPAWGGNADRTAIYASPALVVPRATVDAGVTSGFITASQRTTLNDLATPAGRVAAYGASSPYLNNPNNGYQYTPAYFTAGGRVFTAPISGRQVLSDPNDHANSHDLFWFLDVANQRNPQRTVKSQAILDFVDTDKLSTYGYAIQTRQLVLEEKLSVIDRYDLLDGMTLTFGPSVRYTDGKILQDYTDEPFGRRDITLPTVSPNTVLLAGPQLAPDGLNYWSPTAAGGANVHSYLWQFTAFAYAENKLTRILTTHTSFLVADAPYRTRYPDEVDLATPAQRAALTTSDHRDYYNASFSPVLTIVDGLNLYATVQRGTSIDPTQGGAIFGKGNFGENELYEAGLKASLLDKKLFAGLDVFRWEQTQFDVLTVNPELLQGRGIEFELTYAPTADLTFIASAGWQRVRRGTPLPAIRAMPLTEQQWALYGGVFNNGFGPAYFNLSEAHRPAANPDLVYPGTPETQYKFFARYRLPGGWAVAGGPVVNAAYWQNFDRTLRLPGTVVWNLNATYDRGPWSALLAVDNAFDEQYFRGSEPVFGANTLITKAPGAQWRLSLTRRF
jgi:iron complex outermembrane receptor protein